VAPSKKLPPKRALFVKEYLVDFNATQAAIRAGYSPKIARSQGSFLLTNHDIQSAIKVETDKRANRLEITADKVLSEIARLAFSDARKLFDSNGDLIPIHLLDDDTAVTIAGIEVTEIDTGEGKPLTRLKKIKRWDKTKNLELLGRTLALFTDKIIAKVDLDVDAILRDLSGSTRGLPSLMDQQRDKVTVHDQ
jgi:phage terminase small subunit